MVPLMTWFVPLAATTAAPPMHARETAVVHWYARRVDGGTLMGPPPSGEAVLIPTTLVFGLALLTPGSGSRRPWVDHPRRLPLQAVGGPPQAHRLPVVCKRQIAV